ncbi:MAG: outer membrane beta-barrel protein [Flavobacteriales bacterium]|jgi:outer membrane scaffolding protein for murein synthesis (MipA/OmpV family)|nr:outer membrane beta-barrel protein [Flavobacteriales bacterium]HRT52850.1 hypothetical protein [Flavobacteriales bacterium]
MAVALLLATSFVANGQAFEKGTSVVSLGLGITNYPVGYTYTYGYGYYYDYTYDAGIAPALSANYEMGVAKLGPDHLGIGATVQFSGKKHEERYLYSTVDWRSSYIAFGVRANYHFNWFHHIDKLDLYAGVLAGGGIGNSKWKVTSNSGGALLSENNDSKFRPHLDVLIGARYYFTDVIGVYCEFGELNTYANLGLSLKF